VGINHLGALILPNAATAFGVFSSVSSSRTLPLEYEESARVGRGHPVHGSLADRLPFPCQRWPPGRPLTFLEFVESFLWPLIAVDSQNEILPLGAADISECHNTQMATFSWRPM